LSKPDAAEKAASGNMEVVSRSAETETADHDYNTGAGDSVQLNTAMQLAGRLYLSYIAVKVASYQ